MKKIIAVLSLIGISSAFAETTLPTRLVCEVTRSTGISEALEIEIERSDRFGSQGVIVTVLGSAGTITTMKLLQNKPSSGKGGRLSFVGPKISLSISGTLAEVTLQGQKSESENGNQYLLIEGRNCR